MTKRALFLDRTQLALLRDLTYEEYDRVTSGSTIYADNDETAAELREILDAVNELLED
jgi:hypothetical protein